MRRADGQTKLSAPAAGAPRAGTTLVLLGLLLAVTGCRDPAAPASAAVHRAGAGETEHFPTVIRQPSGPPRVATGLTDHQGLPVTVSCSSCHSTTQPDAGIRSSEQLVHFHQGLHYAHGGLTCLSCHNAADYDALRLADGARVEFTQVMTLCGQCHGPQLREYQRGLHGGMTGYWDLSKGPRERLNCIDCHDPHAPEFPLVLPVFPPRDRTPAPRPSGR